MELGFILRFQNAIESFNNNYDLKFHSPFTPEKVLMSLYEPLKQKNLSK